jgi:hypothetical protein
MTVRSYRDDLSCLEHVASRVTARVGPDCVDDPFPGARDSSESTQIPPSRRTRGCDMYKSMTLSSAYSPNPLTFSLGQESATWAV